MGAGSSSTDSSDDEVPFFTPKVIGLLAQFSGESHITAADGLWPAIFAFLEQSRPLQSYRATKFCSRLTRNNPTTQNFVAFLSHLVERVNAFPTVQPRGALNGIVLARLCLHAMMAAESGEDPVRRLAVQIGFNPHSLEGAAPGDGGEMATKFCEALTAQLRASDDAPSGGASSDASGDASSGTSRSMMRLESINTVLVLLSLPLYAGAQAPSPFLDLFICADSALSARLVRGLLEIVMQRVAAQSAREREAEAEANSRPGLLWRLGGAVGGAMFSVVTLPLVLYSALVGDGALSVKRELESFEVATDPLALRALLLVLLLAHHNDTPNGPNTVRNALRSAVDARHAKQRRSAAAAAARDPAAPAPLEGGAVAAVVAAVAPAVRYSELYAAVAPRCGVPAGVLAVYTLLHGNANFGAFLFAQTDPQGLVVPLLHALYVHTARGASAAWECTASELYLMIIVLLLLTQDAAFVQNAHRHVTVNEVPWFKERILENVSLGSLTMTVLLHVVQFNIFELQDTHVHTYSAAALSNMAAGAERMHVYTAQRMTSMLQLLSRKYFYLSRAAAASASASAQRAVASEGGAAGGTEGSAAHGACAPGQDEGDDERMQVAAAYGDLLLYMFQLTNACLYGKQPSRNLQLIYTLLRQRHLFEPFRNDRVFGEHIVHILAMLDVRWCSPLRPPVRLLFAQLTCNSPPPPAIRPLLPLRRSCTSKSSASRQMARGGECSS
jgi:hypothetical protein